MPKLISVAEVKAKHQTDSFIGKLLSYLDDRVVFIQFAGEFKDFSGFHPNYKIENEYKIVFCHLVPAVAHEFAHFVEIDEARFNLSDFGIGDAKGFHKLNKRSYIAATMREERVCGIQSLISNNKKFKVGRNGIWADKFNELNCAGDIFKDFEEFKTACENEFMSVEKTWNFEKIEQIFARRISVLYSQLGKTNQKAA